MLLVRYIIIEFFKKFLTLLLTLLAIVYLFDSVELLRRAASKEGAELFTILKMALYKMPETGYHILPFALLFAAMMTFWSLTKREELTIARSAGLSAWQFILPAMSAGAMISLIYIFIINPLSAHFLNSYKDLEASHLGAKRNLVSLSQSGLWLTQNQEDSNLIFHADRINLGSWTFNDIMILHFDESNNFIKRIDAKKGILDSNNWYLKDAYINGDTPAPLYKKDYAIPTSLSREDIAESFSEPELVSFWELSDFIKLMEEMGLQTTQTRLYFHSLIAQPLFFASIIMLAASFCMRPPRFQNALNLLLLAVASAFSLFFLSSFLKALGDTGQLPILLAAWAPTAVTAMVASNIIMNTEDG